MGDWTIPFLVAIATFLILYFLIRKWRGRKTAERFNIVCMAAMMLLVVYASLTPNELGTLHFSGALLISCFATMGASVFFGWEKPPASEENHG